MILQMHIFAGSAHPALAENLARELKVPLGKMTLKRFSAGECYVRYEESVRGKDVYLLQGAGRNPDAPLMELFLMCQAAKLSFASTVHVILPYFPYARQDRISEPREAISAKVIARLLEDAGADHLITLNLHSDQIQGFFRIPVDVLDARPILAKYFEGKKLKNPIVVSPDIGGAKQVKKMADVLGTDLAIMHKTRSAHHKAEIMEVVGNVEGRTCIIYDDMIDTAGTLLSAKRALEQRKAKEVYVAATHPVFSGPAVERLTTAGFKAIVVTDSIPVEASIPGLTVLPIAPLLAEVIKHIERRESVTDIYKKK